MIIVTETTQTILTPAETENIKHGLDLLHTRCVDLLQKIAPFSTGADNQKKYYKEKIAEINTQIIFFRNQTK